MTYTQRRKVARTDRVISDKPTFWFPAKRYGLRLGPTRAVAGLGRLCRISRPSGARPFGVRDAEKPPDVIALRGCFNSRFRGHRCGERRKTRALAFEVMRTRQKWC